jgi:cell division protein ZapA
MATEPKQTALTIRILGHDYAVACPPDERESLLASAEHVSKRMQAIQRKGKTLGIERIAVLAALNIARDLLDSQRGHEHKHERERTGPPANDEEISRRLTQLQRRIESALDETP